MVPTQPLSLLPHPLLITLHLLPLMEQLSVVAADALALIVLQKNGLIADGAKK